MAVKLTAKEKMEKNALKSYRTYLKKYVKLADKGIDMREWFTQAEYVRKYIDYKLDGSVKNIAEQLARESEGAQVKEARNLAKILQEEGLPYTYSIIRIKGLSEVYGELVNKYGYTEADAGDLVNACYA